MNQQKALQILNTAAGLESGLSADFTQMGISLGYIGNCSMRAGGYDHRSWGFFFPTLRSDTHNMIGRYDSEKALIEAFDSNPENFIRWAK